jgi:hypothetical protein
LAARSRHPNRAPDFAPSFETPGGYVGQAVLVLDCQVRASILQPGIFAPEPAEFSPLAMKWLQNIAQAFRPGLRTRQSALKVAAEARL